jgi:transcriptional regulator with XRE-family HTH domain
MSSRIREERIKRGWSQHALGMRCGLPVPTISGIERGRVYAWPGWRRRLAMAFKLPEAELFAEVPVEEVRTR